MPFVFVSSAREDAAAAVRLSETLKEAGIEVWLDQGRASSGRHGLLETRRAIRQCDVFLALLSSLSLSPRGFVQSEIKEALDVFQALPEHPSFVIPVRLDDCTVEDEVLQGIHWVDFFPSWDVGSACLLHALRERLGEAEAAAPSPRPPASPTPPLIELVRDSLARSFLAAESYRPRLILGSCLTMAGLAVIMVLRGVFEIETRDVSWKEPVIVTVSVILWIAYYFLVSGTVRWRRAERVRREIVRSNEIVLRQLVRRHPLLGRMLVGSWLWRSLLTVLQIAVVTAGLFAYVLLLLAGSYLIQRRWDLAGGALVIALGLASFAVLTARRVRRVWHSFQAKAGVPGL
jgi:hypothetical protein